MKWALKNKLRAVLGLTYVIPGILFFARPASTQTNETGQPASELKKLSLEELFEMEVTTVSNKPEKLSETAAAIHVVTNEDIRRSGALSIPEALRDVPGIEVPHVDSRQYALTAHSVVLHQTLHRIRLLGRVAGADNARHTQASSQPLDSTLADLMHTPAAARPKSLAGSCAD